MRAENAGLLWVLSRSIGSDAIAADVTERSPTRFADAVAAAALDAAAGGERRAVVLVVSNNSDSSVHDAAEVRAYLLELGVPLYVWAIEPVSSAVAAKWGAIQRIGDWRQLHDAAERLRKGLDAQRIVWVSTDVLQAGALKVDSRCGMAFLSGYR